MLAVYLASVKPIIITVLKQVGGKIDYISVSTITYTEREATQPGQMEPGEEAVSSYPKPERQTKLRKLEARH